MKTKSNDIRMRIRKLCYRTIGYTSNEIELFLLNRFPDSVDSYWSEWIDRLHRPTFLSYMDEDSKDIWFSVIRKIHKHSKFQLVEVEGETE